MSNSGKFYGKYRGTVTDNVDPEFRGRLLIMVPDVAALIPATWAEPCVPLAGPIGPPMGAYLVPPIGTGVWVEFEQGDPNYPIWVGCRWGQSGSLPPLALTGTISPNIVFQSLGQNALIITDLPGPAGGIMLKSATGAATLIVNDTGIYLQTLTGASLTLTANTVIVNEGALTVM
jgi:uncharacterized protein involved in type VI secretion and phage assembly